MPTYSVNVSCNKLTMSYADHLTYCIIYIKQCAMTRTKVSALTVAMCSLQRRYPTDRHWPSHGLSRCTRAHRHLGLPWTSVRTDAVRTSDHT